MRLWTSERLEDRTLLSAVPVADVADPGPVYEGDGLTLDASGSYDDDFDQLSFAWDINGDGTFGEVTGESPALLWDDLQSFGLGDDGIHTIGVEVSDGVDGSDIAYVDVTVVNTDPMVMDFSTFGTPAYPGDTITVDATFTDPAGSADSYTYIIDWGDQSSTGPISVSYGSGISETHEYATAGSYTISVTVEDDDGGFDTWTDEVPVDPVNPTVTGDSTVDEGWQYMLSLDDWTGDGADSWTVDWGDGSAPETIPGSGASAYHTYADDSTAQPGGQYTIQATAHYNGMDFPADPHAVTVWNVDPLIDNALVSGGPTFYVGDEVTVDATFEDPAGVADELYHYVVDWGDSSSDGADVPYTYPNLISTTHAYAAAGDYTITVTVTDDEGGYATWTDIVSVVDLPPYFDPSYYEFSVSEDAEVGTGVGQVYAYDPEGEQPTYTLGLGPGIQGPIQFAIDEETGTITVASSLDYEAQPSHSLVAYATDPAGNPATADVMIIVNDVEELPTAVGDIYYVLPGIFLDTSASGLPSVLDNDTDPEDDPLTAALDTGPSTGNLYGLNADGHFTYLAPNSGTDTFTYIASDGDDDSDSATVTIHVIEVSIKYPHGDPTQSATDWGNRDSDEANVGNEWTFSGGAVAGLSTVSIDVEAEITPAAVAVDAAEWLRWTIEDVGPVQAEWSTHVDGDVHTGKGLITTADFITPATGLPAANNAFGGKTISLSLAGSGTVDSTTVEIFYPRDAQNHPGADQTPAGQGSNRSPNWFYYWNLTGAGNLDALYNSNTPAGAGPGAVPAMLLWAPALAHPKTEIWINDPAVGSYIRRDGSGGPASGIDMFANVVQHEAVHVDQIADADALLGALNGMAGTIWASGWSWNQAPNNHYTLGADGQPGVAGVDDDGDGMTDEMGDHSEVGFAGSDDVDLDLDNDDIDNATEPRTVEGMAKAAETVVEDTFWQQDWGSPGKQHKTNQKYDD